MAKSKVKLKPLRKRITKSSPTNFNFKETLTGFISVVVIIVCLFFINNQFASAGVTKIYYVDQSSIGGRCSDGNSGTINSPFCTIQKATMQATPGSEIVVREGEYSPFIINKKAHVNSPINIKSYPNEIVKIKAGEEDAYAILVNKSHNVGIAGLIIDIQDNELKHGIKVQESDVVNINNIKILGTGLPIEVENSTNTTIRDNQIENYSELSIQIDQFSWISATVENIIPI
jgi:hypothetical protein